MLTDGKSLACDNNTYVDTLAILSMVNDLRLNFWLARSFGNHKTEKMFFPADLIEERFLFACTGYIQKSFLN